MTSVTEFNRRRPAPALGTFERHLTVWVALCIIAGIVLGRLLPAPFQALGRMTVAEVNIPVAVLIWLMIVPMLLKVDFGALHRVAEQWRGIAVTVGINWLVKPFSMALLGWLFIGWMFRRWLPADQIDSYIAGLIILAAAPCRAMVFVWSNLTDGDPNFTLSQSRSATPSWCLLLPQSWHCCLACPRSRCHGRRSSFPWFSTSSCRSSPPSCGGDRCWRKAERRRSRALFGVCSRSR